MITKSVVHTNITIATATTDENKPKKVACQKVLRILFHFIWPPIFGDIRKTQQK